MKNCILIFILLAIFFSSCKKKIDSSGTDGISTNYFAFGDAYGFCMGNCTNFFLLENGQLYPDSMDRMQSPWVFSKTELNSSKRDRAKKLLSIFPSYLKSTTNCIIGCPDCHDQGGYYIEYRADDGSMKSLIIDTEEKALPVEVIDFVKELRVVIDSLKV